MLIYIYKDGDFVKVIVQRCLNASVRVDSKLVSSIDNGLVLLVAFTHDDNESDIDYMVRKVINLRIFDDDSGIMNYNILKTGGSILCVSQFTLYGDVSHGNRPSYIKSLNGSAAIKLYDLFCDKLNMFAETKKGVFGADMRLSLINDGPVTIIIDSKK